jgi:hypothetical protein
LTTRRSTQSTGNILTVFCVVAVCTCRTRDVVDLAYRVRTPGTSQTASRCGGQLSVTETIFTKHECH